MAENIAKNNQEQWANILKVFAILFVVFTHSNNPASLTNIILNIFMLPIFFFCAGYYFNYEKYKLDFKNYVKKSVQRLLAPYFFTLVICYVYSLIVSNLSIDQYLPILGKMICGWLYSCGNVIKPAMDIIPCGVIWFLTCLFVCRILFFLVLRIFEKFQLTLFQKIVILYVIGLAGIITGKYIFLPWSIDIALAALYFMFGGYITKQHKLLEKKADIFFLIFAGILLYSNVKCGGLSLNNRSYFVPLLSLNTAVVFSFLFSKLSIKISQTNFTFLKNALAYCGKYSLIILIFHLQDEGYFHFDFYIPYYKQVIMSNCYYLFFVRIIFSVLCIELIKILPVFSEIYLGTHPYYYKFFKKTEKQNENT